MISKLKWQSPTNWSEETTDGKYYIEVWRNGGKLRSYIAYAGKINLGYFQSMELAKKACEDYAAQGTIRIHEECVNRSDRRKSNKLSKKKRS